MNPNDFQTLLQPLEAAFGSLSPQDWLQFASVAVLSWLGGRAIQGRQEGGDAPQRLTVKEATRHRNHMKTPETVWPSRCRPTNPPSVILRTIDRFGRFREERLSRKWALDDARMAYETALGCDGDVPRAMVLSIEDPECGWPLAAWSFVKPQA